MQKSLHDTVSTQSWITRLDGSEFKVMALRDGNLPTVETVMDTPERIVDYLTHKLPGSLRYSPDTESFGVVMLNTRRRLIGFQIISNGTLDTVLVHPREVFRPAIVLNASAVVLFHNHPSGDPCPSEGDVKVTRDLIRAGQLMRIEILDHVVLGTSTAERLKSWSSLRELGFFHA